MGSGTISATSQRRCAKKQRTLLARNVMTRRYVGARIAVVGSLTTKMLVMTSPTIAPTAMSRASDIPRNQGTKLNNAKATKASVGQAEKKLPCTKPHEWNVGQSITPYNHPTGN